MPEYRINLDPRNPGQYFACCGLFEAAELVAPGGLACFEDGESRFSLLTDAACPPAEFFLEPEMSFAIQKLEPLALRIGQRKLDLDWWLDNVHREASEFKSWAGQQSSRSVLQSLLPLLDRSVPVEGLFDAENPTTTRFGFDARSAWDPLDFGYSPNDDKQEATTFPWVEVLAAVGLQGFRPSGGKRKYMYRTWGHPLPIVAARAASAMLLPLTSTVGFQFRIGGRGKSYKTFLFAERI